MKTIYTNNRKNPISLVIMLAALIFAGTSAKAQVASTSNENVTPALMMSFTGQASAQEGELNWVTENETSAKCFVVERSGNGNDFDSIGVVSCVNNAQMTTYSFCDHNPSNGNNYYRLREVDNDDVFRYSQIISLDFSIAAEKMEIFPNPASAVVNYTVNSHVADVVTVQIFNLAGVLISVREESIGAGANQQAMAISNLHAGQYILKVTGKQGLQFTQVFSKI